MAILESGKVFGIELFKTSGNAVIWITTKTGIPFSERQITSATLIILISSLYIVLCTEKITKPLIKWTISILIIWLILGFFL